MVRLGELVRELGGSARTEGDDPVVLDVVQDSRRVTRGALFAALSGDRLDGARYVPEALARGATAVLCARDLELGGEAPLGGPPLPIWVHPFACRVAGEAAAIVHGRPSGALLVAAVTGTNGKTSVAHMAAQLLEAGGKTPAVLGTVGHRIAGAGWSEARNTTPEATEIQRLLARHRAAGGDCAVLEASSHGIVQERLAGLELDVAVFTNLSRDHLDYHGDMDGYRAAKRRLFEGLAPGATAIVSADDPAGDEMARAAARRGARVLRFGAAESAELRAVSIRPEPGRTVLELRGLGAETRRIVLPLVGRHGVENALAAAGVALAAGVPADLVAGALERVRSAPGRLERVQGGRPEIAVYVDYAHTEQALERVLAALRAELAARGGAQGRLLCVFGCGGERDTGKRAPMGAVVQRLADVALVTSDNPRGEEPAAIARDVLAGMRGPSGAEVIVELDRAAAIQRAVRAARAGDVVLVAGKGHEPYQEAAGVRRPFDDREVAREALA